MTDKRRGRPAGYIINPDAIEDLLGDRSRAAIARDCEVSPAHFSEMLAGTKGATEDVALRIAAVLGVRPGHLFPQLAKFRVQVRQFTVDRLTDEAS